MPVSVNKPLVVKRDDKVVREQKLKGLEKLIKVLRDNPDLSVPYEIVDVSIYVYELEDVQKWAKALPGKKVKEYTSSAFNLTNDLGLGTHAEFEHGYYVYKGTDGNDYDTTMDDINNRFQVTYEMYSAICVLNKEYNLGIWINVQHGIVGVKQVNNVNFTVRASRESVCEKVVTGKQIVEEKIYPHVEPVTTLVEKDVIEWVCKPILGSE